MRALLLYRQAARHGLAAATRLALLASLMTVLLAAACDSNGNHDPQDDLSTVTLPDLSVNPDMTTACATDPKTHVELVNACTNADSVDKMPFYPTLAPNGQLPPLP